MLAAVIAVVLVGVLAPDPAAWADSRENQLTNPPGMADRLDFIDTREAFVAGERQRVELVDTSPPRLVLADGRNDEYPREGTWTSRQVDTAFAFTELVPSWNIRTPADTGVWLDVRVRDASRGTWSPWLFLGTWGRTTRDGRRVTTFRDGAVNTDYIALRRPADAYQVRVSFQSFSIDANVKPEVRRVSVAYSGVAPRLAESTPAPPADAWARDLRVPFRTQNDAAKCVSGEICSPTSLSMVMHHFGVDRPTHENALVVYDAEYDIFGNWGRAVARAGELGFDAWLARFRNWDQVKAEIARGQPVIASIRFRAGEFPGNVLDKTAGHLIVVRGFTPGGDVIVNDPASRDRGNGIVYSADALARAWFGHGGVGYVVRPAGGGASPGRLVTSSQK